MTQQMFIEWGNTTVPQNAHGLVPGIEIKYRIEWVRGEAYSMTHSPEMRLADLYIMLI